MRFGIVQEAYFPPGTTLQQRPYFALIFLSERSKLTNCLHKGWIFKANPRHFSQIAKSWLRFRMINNLPILEIRY